MAGFDTGSPVQSKAKNKYLKHSGKGVKIDMTPMVDVIMLLLTFFMLTSVLNKPQVMTINLPKGEEKVQFDNGNALYLRTSAAGKIFLSMGNPDGTENKPEAVAPGALQQRLEELYAGNSSYVLLIKFDRETKYNVMVDILDEINTAGIQKRYVFKPMEEADKNMVKLAGG